MKKLILIMIVSMGVLSSCIDHSENRRNFEQRQKRDSVSRLTKRVIKPINQSVKFTTLVDTIYQVGDTIQLEQSDIIVVILK
jgi:hypothetical protein